MVESADQNTLIRPSGTFSHSQKTLREKGILLMGKG
jgi:hypothetical protein